MWIYIAWDMCLLYVARRRVLAMRSAMTVMSLRAWPALHRHQLSYRRPLPTCWQAQLSKQPALTRQWPIPLPRQWQASRHRPTMHQMHLCYLSHSWHLRHSAKFHHWLCFSTCHCQCSSRYSSQFLFTFSSKCWAVCRHHCRNNLDH